MTTLLLSVLLSNQSFALRGGTPEKNLFPASVFFQGAFFCSSVKVSPHLYLLAAHCVNSVEVLQNDVQPPEPPKIPSETSTMPPEKTMIPLEVRLVSGLARKVHLQKIFFHTSWRRWIQPTDDEDLVNQKILSSSLSDLALIQIEENLVIPEAKISFRPVGAHEAIFLTGFGALNDEGEGAGRIFSFGLIRALKIKNQYLLLDPGHGTKGQAIELMNGDSGSAAYIKDADGQMKVVGINSWKRVGEFSNQNALARLDLNAGDPNVQNWICGILRFEDCKK